MHIIQDYGLWKKVNEDSLPGREKTKGTEGNKLVAIPVDKNKLKIKIVNEDPVLDKDEKLIPARFDAIVNWIKSQGDIINAPGAEYGLINDLSTNVVIYSVEKSNNRKQVLTFTITSKTALKQNDPSAKGINPAVKFIRTDELPMALGGKILNGSNFNTNTPQSQLDGKTSTVDGSGLTLPVKGSSIVGSTSRPVIDFIIKAYNAVKVKVQGNPILAKVKSEIQADRLDTGSQTFVKALNAGFGILETRTNEDIEVDITKTLVDKIANPDSLNVTEFQKIAKSSSPINTGDIKVPETGFKGGSQGDPELKKFQDVLLKKFKNKLRDHTAYQEFAKAGRKGFVGNYGQKTANLIYLLKTGIKPTYPNTNPNVIEPELVDAVLALNESYYLGLDGFTLINESDYAFDFATVPTNLDVSNVSDSGAVIGKKSVSSKKGVQYAAKPNNFDVKAFQNWLVNTKKEAGWSSSDADGKWGPKTATAYTKYKDTYKPGASKGSTRDKTFDTIINEIINKFRTGLTDFKGAGGDNVNSAFSELKRMWTKSWSTKLSAYSSDDNYKRLSELFKSGSKLYLAMEARDDEFSFRYFKEGGDSKLYKIPTDF